MAAPSPIACVWTGETFRPLPGHFRRAAEQYGEGEVVTLAPVEDRSAASHRHYFAAINEAFQNLPEVMTERFASPEHLRKYALVRAGYRDERTIVASSKAEAKRLEAFIKPMDEYAFVVRSEATVTVYTAKSQNMRAMGKAEFQASKDKVLTVLASLIGVDVTQLRARAEAA